MKIVVALFIFLIVYSTDAKMVRVLFVDDYNIEQNPYIVSSLNKQLNSKFPTMQFKVSYISFFLHNTFYITHALSHKFKQEKYDVVILRIGQWDWYNRLDKRWNGFSLSSISISKWFWSLGAGGIHYALSEQEIRKLMKKLKINILRHPNDPGFYFWQGQIYENYYLNYKKAKQLYLSGLSISQQHILNFNSMALFYLQQKNRKDITPLKQMNNDITHHLVHNLLTIVKQVRQMGGRPLLISYPPSPPPYLLPSPIQIHHNTLQYCNVFDFFSTSLRLGQIEKFYKQDGGHYLITLERVAVNKAVNNLLACFRKYLRH